MYHYSLEKYELNYNVLVGLNNVAPYMTDSPTYEDAVRTYLEVREENWLLENPKPSEVKLIQGWFIKKLNDLYPSYQFLVDGYEISTEEAFKLNMYIWNIKLQITYDDELSKMLEKEKIC